jgi:protocatechuate 4,5-dioxygenase beta chain
MAEIVGSFLLPHDPLIASEPDAPPAAKKQAVMQAFERVDQRVRDLAIDTVIVIGDDHYTVFGPHCIPRALIAIGEAQGPTEPWLGLPRAPFPTNQPLAQHIMQYGFDNGLDWAVAKDITLDHSVSIPIHYALAQNSAVNVIPVYVNSGVAPVISSRRCFEIGQLMRDAVACWEGSERVAAFGTGGLSHWVGMAPMGQVNVEWDREVLDAVRRGDVQQLIAMDDMDILEQSGNGALEIKNWITALGFMGDCRGTILEYQAVNEWVCGCGFVELEAA